MQPRTINTKSDRHKKKKQIEKLREKDTQTKLILKRQTYTNIEKQTNREI